VRREQEDEADRRRQRALEREHRVRGAAGEERPRPVLPEAPAREPGRGAHAEEPEAQQPEGVIRPPERRDHVLEEAFRLADERRHEALVRASVGAHASRRVGERAAQEHGGLAVERVGDRDLGP
jgi:hypothetical protein